ncbi:hypothetical protein TNCV_1815061 [Trichonephila clavipes]|nr:hypothetical protein TNCV_1815061 [Trichonephila clavipes]
MCSGNSSTVVRVWKQWTVEHKSLQNCSGRRKVTSARDDQHLLHIRMNSFSAASGSPLVYVKSTNVISNNSTSHREQQDAFIQDPPHGKPSTVVCNGLELRQADWHQVVFFLHMNHASNHDILNSLDVMPVERFLPERVIE